MVDESPTSASVALRPSRALDLALVALITSAIVLRFAWPEVIAFGGEQIESVALAYRSWFVETTERGLRVSVGLDMPPFYLWLLSLPVALTRDPVRLTQFVTLVNAVALLVLFRVLARALSRFEALVAVALLSTSPWSFVFARKIWAQDFLLPFTVAWFALLVSHASRPRVWKVIAFALVVSAYAQLYPATWFALGPLALSLWVWRPKVALREALVAFVLALALWIPYVRYQIAVDFDDVRFARAALGGSGGAGVVARDPWSHVITALGVAGGAGLDWLTATAYSAWNRDVVARAANVLALVFLPVAGAASIWAGWRTIRAVRARWSGTTSATRERVLALFVFLCFGVLAQYVALGIPAIPHYHVVSWPAVPVFVACGARALVAAGRLRANFVASCVLALGVVHLAQWITLQRYLVHAGGSEGALAPIFAHDPERLASQLADAIEEARSGRERRREWNAGLRAGFEASSDVLLAIDGACNEPEAACARGCASWTDARGLWFETLDPPGHLQLPPIPDARPGVALLRIDYETSIDAIVLVYFKTEEEPRFKRGQIHELRLERGGGSLFVPLDGAAPNEPVRVAFLCHRALVKRIEVRRV